MATKKKRSRLYQSTEPQVDNTTAMAIVKRYAYYSSGVGAVPIPVAGVLSVNAVQYAMIKKLAAYYDIPFKGQRLKSLISSLLSGVVSASIIYGPITNALTVFTGLGLLFRVGVSVSVSGAVTTALGKLFIDHFERGGSFLDLDVERSRLQLKTELAGKS